jgi:spore coat protein A, manganese oxidase
MVGVTRRAILLKGGLAAASLVVGRSAIEEEVPQPKICRGGGLRSAALTINPVPIRPALHTASLQPFVDALPIPPIARPAAVHSGMAPPGRVFRIRMSEIYAAVHRDMRPTRFWSYGGSVPSPTIHVRGGETTVIEWHNALPAEHFLPIDHRLHGAETNRPQVRTVVHLHGGRTAHESDGYPEDWYTPGNSRLCHYSNHRDAATLWYHDHAIGINRLNIYAGLFGAYLIHDEQEQALNLPASEFDIPLLFCDRMFYRDDHQLYYPVSPYLGAPWVADLRADGTLINGRLFPFLDVQPRKYRFRIIVAANNRGFDLSLANGQPMIQIGTDQGLLSAPLPRAHVLLAPGERAEVIIDFSALRGARLALNSGAQAVLQFRVADGEVADPSSVPERLCELPRLLPATAVKTRRMTLTEHDDRAGEPVAMTLNEAHWDDPVTETPTLNSTEIWEFLNLTDDVHPIHLHLVRFQLLNRQNFDGPEYLRSGKTVLIGPPVPPEPPEAGWKDTIRVHPGSITRIIVRFEGYTGRYLWHCHILEHEANEMMRPFEVRPPTSEI